MRVSIAVCTRDRAGVVGRAVRGAVAEASRNDAEVVAVDNASTDATPTVLASIATQAGGRVRVVREDEVGLSAARNRALAEARGEVVVYLDDDAVPRPGWLDALLAPYAAPDTVCVGGPVVLRFDGSAPAWLRPPLDKALSAYELGDRPRRVRWRPGDEYPYGANISFRAATARAAGGFSRWVGPRGDQPFVHDETDLCFRLDRDGGTLVYTPHAVVDHWIMAERLTPAWFLRRHWYRGRSSAAFELKNRGLHRTLGRVRWYYGAHLLLRAYRPHEPVDGERLLEACLRREALGFLAGIAEGVLRRRVLRHDAASFAS
jgi:glycosyltransferase involved in cell wall biosynthesis